MSTSPKFPDACRLPVAVCTAAKTTYSDNTNAVLFDTAASMGTAYSHIAATPRATVTVTQLQLYKCVGSTYSLIATALMGAYTMTQTTQPPITAFTHCDGTPLSESNPLKIEFGASLYVGIGVALAAGIVFVGQAGDYTS